MKKSYDVVIVGAGPAGTVAARFAAEQGISVLVLEKDRDVGYPVRCGEAISHAGVAEFIEPDQKFIASTITKFGMVSPDGTEVIVPLEEKGYVLERRIFDYELGKMASSAGAEILTRAYVNGLMIKDDKVCGVKFEYRGEKREVEAKVVIGADGVESRVGRWAGIKTYIDFRDMECCTQITASGIPIGDDTCFFYFGQEYAPQGYFWVFPKGENTANIGLGVSGMVGRKRSAQSFLDHFMDKFHPDASIMTRIAGGVPCVTTLEKISAPGIILVGDAARQVNPLSGGGIASGMIGGKIGGTIAAKAIKENNLDLILNYDKAWNDRLGKRHEIFDKIKNGIYNFTDEKFNDIAHSFNKVPMEKRSLGNLFKKALINNPSLLVDIAKVFVFK
ncbi:MAG: NAD(P)/FAD-dependent oxidoreductase [Melioribacteraceae bacterium]|nr:NAD(P)/FAD-dependent oxidoreductase [Melioribacteraceae bacterium]MCF8263296.1 NAD(P)/FAD-dependent oxidoreductase [Melioribacteraceae bacterium]